MNEPRCFGLLCPRSGTHEVDGRTYCLDHAANQRRLLERQDVLTRYEEAHWSYDEREWWTGALICKQCAAVVLGTATHDAWHEQLRSVVDALAVLVSDGSPEAT